MVSYFSHKIFKLTGRNSSGFTLIELLVVISIIGLLASILLVSLNNAKIKSKDARRKADLRQLASAMSLYYQSFNTYLVAGTGANNSGSGWFSFTGVDSGQTYTKSVAQGLKEAGILAKVVTDPSGAANGTTAGNTGYMIFPCSGSDFGHSFALFAALEKPDAADTATYTNKCVTPNPQGGMNYVIQVK